MNMQINHETKEHMFTAIMPDGACAGMMSYVPVDSKTISVSQTMVPKEFGGMGIAKKLLEACTAYARNENKKIVSTCSFVTSQFQKHKTEYQDIIG